MSFEGLVFPQASLGYTGRNSIFYFWADSRSFQTIGCGKFFILNTYIFFILYTYINLRMLYHDDVNELRNMS